MYHGVNAPEGYFACNGQSFSATEYPILRNVLGSTIVPDLRGYFIRGYDTRNAVDPDGTTRRIGEYQRDAIQNITGDIFSDCFTRAPGTGTGPFRWYQSVGGASGSAKSSGSRNGGFTFDASRSVYTSSEVRPKNKTLLYCIKHD